jgi:DNA-cytosine methyltransferase
MGINVLSLFDGMSCGQIALEKAGIKVDNYYASEIKPFAIKCTLNNYPNTIQLGDVTKWESWNLPNIDLIIGGSPCQDFSQANKNRLGLKGEKSSLFHVYNAIVKHYKPKWFFLENVEMEQEDYEYISNEMGTYPIKINSELVSAQLRSRVYWTNIGYEYHDLIGRRYCDIPQPKDKKIKFKDVIESGYTDRTKARAITESVSRPNKTPVKMFHRYYATGFTNLIFKSKQHYLDCKQHYDLNYNGFAADDIDLNNDNSVYDGVRYPTVLESERLQTVPIGYTDCVEELEALSLLGDGWNVDTIVHMFNYLKNEL